MKQDSDSLCIIIPAFKFTYLEEALFSLSQQTNQNFSVYVGDDNSPFNLYSIVQKFEKRLSIFYTRFDTNLGSISLTKHWERCISLSKNEKWIWLFSDDDIAGPNCVEIFFKTIHSTKNQCDVYKFETTIIDKNGSVLRRSRIQDEIISSRSFLHQVVSFKIDSFACEYIFKRNTYELTGKFVEFPLAWCSDIASWARIGASNGICQMSHAEVKWRYSDENLSSNHKKNYAQKEEAILLFIQWLNQNFQDEATFETQQIYFFTENARHNKMPINLKEFTALAKKITLLFPDKQFYIYLSLTKSAVNLAYYRLKAKIRKLVIFLLRDYLRYKNLNSILW